MKFVHTCSFVPSLAKWTRFFIARTYEFLKRSGRDTGKNRAVKVLSGKKYKAIATR